MVISFGSSLAYSLLFVSREVTFARKNKEKFDFPLVLRSLIRNFAIGLRNHQTEDYV